MPEDPDGRRGLPDDRVPGLIIILVIVLIVFGPKKLPEIGGAVGKTFAEFKKSTKGLIDDDDDSVKKVEKKSDAS
ncbi:twin-arginine translocase TatA/TatE family subunit [Bacillus cereus]|uniref:twin-arginine translocase TatA/TatE family subunit n=1 Tax=Bacillus cereus TaxID=1396 RepID=UPI003D02D520